MKTIYTYHIAWSQYNKHYYGVRYANIYNPKLDLWKTYFTSSRHVKNFRKMHGEPDVIEIRKQFIISDSKDYFAAKKIIRKARAWERTVLRRLKVKINENWLNVQDGCKKLKKARTPEQLARTAKKQEKRERRLRERRAKKEQNVTNTKPKKLSPSIKTATIIYSKQSRADRKQLMSKPK